MVVINVHIFLVCWPVAASAATCCRWFCRRLWDIAYVYIMHIDALLILLIKEIFRCSWFYPKGARVTG